MKADVISRAKDILKDKNAREEPLSVAQKAARTKISFSKSIIALACLFALGFQGLYFHDSQQMALLLTALLLMAIAWRRGGLRLPKDPISGYLGLTLLITLGLWPLVVEKGMHLFALTLALFYGLFWLLINQLDDDAVAWVKQAFTVTMALFGLISTVAFVTGALEDFNLVIHHRVAGPIQYANTFGLLLLAALMLSLHWKMPWYLRWPLTMALTVPMVLTMSRGTYGVAILMIGATWVICKGARQAMGAVVVSTGLGFFLMKLYDQTETANRLSEGFGASEWQSRLLYYEDALRMIWDNPLGLGYNGYHYLQSYWQTGATYHVKFVHSGILQAFLDIGIIGGLLFAIFMVYLVFVRAYPMKDRLVVMALLGHSLVDMNLSFPVVSLLVLVLVRREGLGLAEGKTVKESRWPKGGRWAFFLGGMAVMALAGWLLSGVLLFNQGSYREAIHRYPGYTEAYRRMLRQKTTEDWMVPYAETLYEANPFITELYPVLIDHAVAAQDFEKGTAYSKAYVTYSPLHISHHERHSRTLIHGATWHLAHGNLEASEGYVRQILAMPGHLAELANDRRTNYNVNHQPDLRMSPALMKDYSEAGHIMEKIKNGR